jgi:hypothetical protein
MMFMYVFSRQRRILFSDIALPFFFCFFMAMYRHFDRSSCKDGFVFTLLFDLKLSLVFEEKNRSGGHFGIDCRLQLQLFSCLAPNRTYYSDMFSKLCS